MSARVITLDVEREARRKALREGVPLPCNLNIERVVIGTILTEAQSGEGSQALALVRSMLHGPTDFYDDSNRIVYEAICDLEASGVSWDVVLVNNMLRSTGKLEKIGGPNSLTAMVNDTMVATSRNLRQYAATLAQIGQRRRMATLGLAISAEARTDLFEDPNEFQRHEEAGKDPVAVWLQSCARRVEQVAQPRQDSRPRRIGEILPDVVKTAYAKRERVEAGKEAIAGLSTGSSIIDTASGGLHTRGDYLLICGKPGQGKTSLMCGLCMNVAGQGHYTETNPDGRWRSSLLFSLEMPAAMVAARIACQKGRVDFFQIENGTANGGELARFAQACEQLRDLSIYIDDSKQLGPETLKLKVRMWFAECDQNDEEPSLCAIDYFQLMRSKAVADRRGNREAELNECAGSVKNFSDECAGSGRRVAFALGAQLNKAGDIKHCESANEHAATRWNIEHDEPKGGRIEAVPARIKILKARYGPVGNAALWFHPRYTLFSDSDR